MAYIEFEDVELSYPVRENRGVTLKELFLQGLLRREQKKDGPSSQHYVESVLASTIMSASASLGTMERVRAHCCAPWLVCIRSVADVGRWTVMCASLFDIGLGFEYSSTGWENIRFRGYLQGETPTTIEKKAGEIAEFAELGEF